MEIEFQLSKKDYFEASRLYLKDMLQKRAWVFILLVLIFIAALSGETKELWRFLFSIIASPIIVIVILYFVPLLIIFVRVNKALAKDKSGLEKKRLTFSDEGLLIESETKSQVRKWESIVSAQSNDKFIYLILADKKMVTFPKRAFINDSEATNFLGLIQSQIIQKRGGSNFQINNSKSKPPYLLGLLCIIPLVGAIVGFALLLYGIFKYKDKWLIIIGIAGIVWTVGIYNDLFNTTRNNAIFKKLFAESSQMELNSLMKYVEFYKLQHGVYPDSLKQISKDDEMAPIYDPIQSANRKPIKFNYQKIGTHYYLFSSGIDGIPNTKDDIYPQVASSDSAKFGLIRKSY